MILLQETLFINKRLELSNFAIGIVSLDLV